jgi:hypothetical protein
VSGPLPSSTAADAEMSAKELADVLIGFRRRLTEGGFEHDQAWELCREFFLEMIAPEREREE